jgi:hypothetical protein
MLEASVLLTHQARESNKMAGPGESTTEFEDEVHDALIDDEDSDETSEEDEDEEEE